MTTMPQSSVVNTAHSEYTMNLNNIGFFTDCNVMALILTLITFYV